MPPPGPFKPFCIGRYNVLTRLGAGGMAEVFLAEQRGVGGFSKPVCIKRILGAFDHDPAMLQMFIDEARITQSVQHPNVVQVLELQEDDGQLYMVLEFVDGPDLIRLLTSLHKTGLQLPIPVGLYVASSLLRGLAYAHAARSPDGVPLGLIHRDISPSNVLLTQSGQVKLSDFGVAKALGRLAPRTEAGGIKGKLAYLAPEVLETGNADQRSDVFAAGVVLWEMLTGKRLFKAEQEFQLFNLLMRAEIPAPSTVRPDVGAPLDAIVLKALSRDIEQRFQTARDMELAIYSHIRDRHPDELAADLGLLIAAHAKTLSQKEIAAFPRPEARTVEAPAPPSRPAATQRMPGTPMPTPTSSDDNPPWVADVPTEVKPPAAPPEDDFFAGLPAAQPAPPPAPPQSAPPAVDWMAISMSQPAPVHVPRLFVVSGGVSHDIQADALCQVLLPSSAAPQQVGFGRGAPLETRVVAERLLLDHLVPAPAPRGLPRFVGEYPRDVPGALVQAFPSLTGTVTLESLFAPRRVHAFVVKGMLEYVFAPDATRSLVHALGLDDRGLESLLEKVLVEKLSLPAAAAKLGLVSTPKLRQVMDTLNQERLADQLASGPCRFAVHDHCDLPYANLPPSMVPFGLPGLVPQGESVEEF